MQSKWLKFLIIGLQIFFFFVLFSGSNGMCRVRTHVYARTYARAYCVFASAYAHAYAYNSCAYVRAYCEYARSYCAYALAYAQLYHAYVRAYARAYILFFQKLRKKIKRMFPSFDFVVQYNKCGQACICFICVTLQLCTASPNEQWTTMSSSKQNKLSRFRLYPGIYFWFSYTRIMLSAYDSRTTH